MCDRKGIGLIGRQRRVQTDIHAIPFRQISGQFINRLFLETQGFFCPKARDRNIRGFLFYAGNTFFTHGCFARIQASRHTVIFNIYRYGGTRAVCVVNGWNRNRWYLCTDGSLANEGSSSAFESSYSYYRYTSGELQHLETLLYLDGGSGGSPWRYSATADHYVSSGDFRSVTEAEATAVRDKYTHETLILTPFVV